MKWKIIAISSGCAFLALLSGVFISHYLGGVFGLHRLNSVSVVTEIQKLNQLVTLKCTVQRVVGLREPKVPFGEESILLMVQGEVLAGVDLATVTANDVHYTGSRSVAITLPAAKLFETFLDEKQTKVWDRQVTWWTPWVPYDPDLEHKARLQAINDIRSAALSMGILDQAQQNAEHGIRSFLSAFEVQASFKTRSLD